MKLLRYLHRWFKGTKICFLCGEDIPKDQIRAIYIIKHADGVSEKDVCYICAYYTDRIRGENPVIIDGHEVIGYDEKSV